MAQKCTKMYKGSSKQDSHKGPARTENLFMQVNAGKMENCRVGSSTRRTSTRKFLFAVILAKLECGRVSVYNHGGNLELNRRENKVRVGLGMKTKTGDHWLLLITTLQALAGTKWLKVRGKLGSPFHPPPQNGEKKVKIIREFTFIINVLMYRRKEIALSATASTNT